MKTNRLFKILLLIGVLAMGAPITSTAAITPAVENTETRATELQKRLAEINALDKKDLSRGEKRALRVEVRNIEKEMAEISGGVYLSIGAIILIALLLILLL
jgi:hypothetical protein